MSLFPDFESNTQFDIDSYSVHIPDHFASEAESNSEARCLSPSASRASLLPKTSLSQLNLNQTYAEHGRFYRPTQLSTVPEALEDGPSRQASLVSLQSFGPSKSTLRLRDSRQSLQGDHVLSQSQVPCVPKSMNSQPRLRGSLKDVRSLAGFQAHVEKPQTPALSATTNGSQPRSSTPARSPIASIKNFESFCVLDTYLPGHPVVATSEDLKYVSDVGEHFFLNNQECRDKEIDMIPGYDADGNDLTRLVFYSPLISPSTGRSRYLLAALVDVTDFMNDAVTVSELDMISEESVLDEGIATPVHAYQQDIRTRDVVSRTSKYELSCEDLLGGCFIDDSHRPMDYCGINNRGNIPRIGMYADTDLKHKPSVALLDDVWTELAREEGLRGRNSPFTSTASTRSGHCTPHSSPSLSDPTSTGSNEDDVVDSFMARLQQLYSDFFLLAISPLDDTHYEICNVSPSVYASKAYVDKHLSRSSRGTMARLCELLGEDTAFDIRVRWGIAGEAKQLYCIPLFGQRSLTWICMLVNVKLGALW